MYIFYFYFNLISATLTWALITYVLNYPMFIITPKSTLNHLILSYLRIFSWNFFSCHFYFCFLLFCINLLRLDFNKDVKINSIRPYTGKDVKEWLSKSPLWFLMHKANRHFKCFFKIETFIFDLLKLFPNQNYVPETSYQQNQSDCQP